MQIDFHYCVTRILAEKAGFPPNEAQTIAYACQYIDDATLYRPVRLPFFIKSENSRIKDHYLDPVCTAHKGFQMFTDFNKSIQQKVYMSFHFLPPEIYHNQHIYSYVVVPDSNFANILVDNALKFLKNNPQQRTLSLIKLGIALHTYADTFAHQGFSGRHNSENAVNNLHIMNIFNKWQKISKFLSFRSKIMPQIGHAEALSLPDYPFMIWKYNKDDETLVVRNNIEIYITAANQIYKRLCNVSPGKPRPFADFANKLIKIFAFPTKSKVLRFLQYQIFFPDIIFFYNSKQWILEILNPLKHIDIKHTTNEFKWLLFHQAAAEQRDFVLQNIKQL